MQKEVVIEYASIYQSAIDIIFKGYRMNLTEDEVLTCLMEWNRGLLSKEDLKETLQKVWHELNQ